VIDHITVQVSDVARSRAFYETLLRPLGISATFEDADGVGFFGPESGALWLTAAERPETRELHVAFRAWSRDQVRRFHQAAEALGAEVLHSPQIFTEYDPDYYAVFVRDPDGHNIEAVCRLPE